jgi:Ice-binding-like
MLLIMLILHLPILRSLSPTWGLPTAMLAQVFSNLLTTPRLVVNWHSVFVQRQPNIIMALGSLGGLTLTGGIYKYSGAVSILTSVTFSGSATDSKHDLTGSITYMLTFFASAWVMQVGSTLTQAGATSVFLTGGALATNIFWIVPGAVIIGPGATFRGILLTATSVTLQTGATLIGRILSQTAVALQKATVYP